MPSGISTKKTTLGPYAQVSENPWFKENLKGNGKKSTYYINRNKAMNFTDFCSWLMQPEAIEHHSSAQRKKIYQPRILFSPNNRALKYISQEFKGEMDNPQSWWGTSALLVARDSARPGNTGDRQTTNHADPIDIGLHPAAAEGPRAHRTVSKTEPTLEDKTGLSKHERISLTDSFLTSLNRLEIDNGKVSGESPNVWRWTCF